MGNDAENSPSSLTTPVYVNSGHDNKIDYFFLEL